MLKKLSLFVYIIVTGLLIFNIVVASNVKPKIKLTDDLTAGMMLVKDDEPGYFREIPKLDTDVKIRIEGMAVSATIDQVYTNDNPEPIEAIYVFPLPETAAINEMQFIIGDRFIEGIVKERAEAKKTYEKAKEEGKRAALTEQERPNIFTNSVANIMPGDTIIVRLKYVDVVDYDYGRFTFRFPTVVGPRYIPGNRVTGYSGGGWSFDTDVVKDAGRITPPVVPESTETGNRISFKIELNTNLPIDKIESPSHDIDIIDKENGNQIITLSKSSEIPNRTFILTYAPEAKSVPQAALFSANKDDENYFMLMTIPPEIKDTVSISKEFIFVLDISGSMMGESIIQAREGLKTAIDKLHENDYFNIITFNDNYYKYKSNSVPATKKNKLKAKRFINKQNAGSGTEAYRALSAAFKMIQKGDSVPIIFFTTDGAIGNEKQLLRLIRQGNSLQKIRFFPIGIGSAPNSFLLRKAGEYGQGVFTYISNTKMIKEKMTELFRRISQPVLTNVTLDIDNENEIYPNPIPDLYQGEPLVVFGKLKGDGKTAALSGRTSKSYTTIDIPLHLHNAGKEPAIPTLWARKKISGLMDSYMLGDKTVKDSIITLAINHSLLTKFTSFVAVEEKIVNPHKELSSVNIPTDIPKGWQYDAVFNQLKQKKFLQVDNNKTLHGTIHLASLPQTATNYPLQLLVGLVLIVAGFMLNRYVWMEKI